MKIQENDFTIDHNGASYVLHLKKTKGELKEDPESNFKVKGYYVKIKSSIKAVVGFRNGKKYPFKESAEKLQISLNRYSYLEKQFEKESKKLYNKIVNAKKEVLNGL